MNRSVGGGRLNLGNQRRNNTETVKGDNTAICLLEAILIAYFYALMAADLSLKPSVLLVNLYWVM